MHAFVVRTTFGLQWSDATSMRFGERHEKDLLLASRRVVHDNRWRVVRLA